MSDQIKEEKQKKASGQPVKKGTVVTNDEEKLTEKQENFSVKETVSSTVAGSTLKGLVKKKKKKLRMQVLRGRIYVRSSYNNTSVLATDLHGNTLAWSSSGLLGFKGAKKSTTYAATQVVLDLYEKVQKFGLKEVDVFVKGVGAGRDSAVRTLSQKGFSINLIKDETPIPHNGCRPPKPRRV